MKILSSFAAILLMTGSVLAADSIPKDDVLNAAKKLGAADNYSWKSTVVVPEDSPFHPSPTEGKTEKGGFTFITSSFGDTPNQTVLKDGKGALKTDGEWMSFAEAGKDDGGGGFNPTGFLLAIRKNFKAPSAEVENLVAQAKEIKLADGVYSGDLTESGAKELLTFRPPGGEAPKITGAKGWVKFWIADGAITKYQFNLQGKVEFNGQDFDNDRTTTTEIKDVGKTKVEVSEDAKKKIN